MLVSAPPGTDLAAAFTAPGVDCLVPLAPVLDGARLHELVARSQLTAGSGYVAAELAPVHAITCACHAHRACTCGAQALFEALVLRAE